LLCEKTGAIELVLLGLVAGWLAGRQTNSAKFKLCTGQHLTFQGVQQRDSVIIAIPMHLNQLFWVKPILRWDGILTIKYYNA